MSTQHSHTPWRYAAMLSASENHRGFQLLGASDNWPFAMVQPGDNDGALGEANARWIVQCVNSHDALVKALTNLLARCERELADPEDVPEIDSARAALSLAGQQGQKT